MLTPSQTPSVEAQVSHIFKYYQEGVIERRMLSLQEFFFFYNRNVCREQILRCSECICEMYSVQTFVIVYTL